MERKESKEKAMEEELEKLKMNLTEKGRQKLVKLEKEEEKRERLEIKEIKENVWRWRTKRKNEKKIKDKNIELKKLSVDEKYELIQVILKQEKLEKEERIKRKDKEEEK